MKYKSYSARNFKEIPQVKKYLSKREIFDIEVVSKVFPFKVNNYVIERLIRWEEVPNDPMFRLTFPQKGMLLPEDYEKIAFLVEKGKNPELIREEANKIRLKLNPHPAGQKYNVPQIRGKKLTGAQHKYRETILFFPSQGQTCHAYCTFCFRWPQFVGIKELKFAMKEIELLIEYIKEHPEITDVLFTGGDPMIMSHKVFRSYIEKILKADIPHLKTIRIGTKVLSYWPYKFLTDSDAAETLNLFKTIVDAGYNLAFMAHFNHFRECETPEVREATKRIRATGAIIRTQSPILRYINNSVDVWKKMWSLQVEMGMVPYYMFVVRDTGAQHYFGVFLHKAWEIFRDAYRQISGIARTVKGPSMSATPGKIRVLGVSEISGKKVFVLDFLQGRNPEWVGRPFFAKYNEKAFWIDELEPLDKESFFFEKEMEALVGNT